MCRREVTANPEYADARPPVPLRSLRTVDVDRWASPFLQAVGEGTRRARPCPAGLPKLSSAISRKALTSAGLRPVSVSRKIGARGGVLPWTRLYVSSVDFVSFFCLLVETSPAWVFPSLGEVGLHMFGLFLGTLSGKQICLLAHELSPVFCPSVAHGVDAAGMLC